MNKITTVAVIAALALATQAFAMGGGSKGGRSMSSTMATGSVMTPGTHSMAAPAKMSGTGTMATKMSTPGTTKMPMTAASQMQPPTAR